MVGVVGCGWVWLGVAGCGWVWLGVAWVLRLGVGLGLVRLSAVGLASVVVVAVIAPPHRASDSPCIVPSLVPPPRDLLRCNPAGAFAAALGG